MPKLLVRASVDPVLGGLEFIIFKHGEYQTPVAICGAPELDTFFKDYQEQKALAMAEIKKISNAGEMRQAIDRFLKWENDDDRTKATPQEWLEQTEALAKVIYEGDGDAIV